MMMIVMLMMYMMIVMMITKANNPLPENRISKRHRIRLLRHRQTLYQYNRGQLRMHNIVVFY